MPDLKNGRGLECAHTIIKKEQSQDADGVFSLGNEKRCCTMLTCRIGGALRVRTSTSREGRRSGSTSNRFSPITMATKLTPVSPCFLLKTWSESDADARLGLRALPKLVSPA